jgi:peptidoglycan/xylan/chitin deacetylase (PgdA/CDA1 family)
MTAKMYLTASVLAGASMVGINSLMCYLRSRGLSVLMFHGFTNRTHRGMENAGGLHMQAEVFDAVCARLAASHTPMHLQEAMTMLQAGKPLPKRATVLTFDDGYASNARIALPILRRYNIPATIYLATDFVHNGVHLWPDRIEYALTHTEQQKLEITLGDAELSLPLQGETARRFALGALCAALKLIPQEQLYAETARVENALGCAIAGDPDPADIYQPLTWAEAKALASSGLITLGAHTHHHRILGRCSEETARAEIATSRRLIEENTGVKVSTFAYPNGKPGDHSAATRKLLAEMGFHSAVTTSEGFNDRHTDPLTLRRFSQPPTPWHLDAMTSGVFCFLRKLRRRKPFAAAPLPA